MPRELFDSDADDSQLPLRGGSAEAGRQRLASGSRRRRAVRRTHPDSAGDRNIRPLYDPTSPDMLQTTDGSENPPSELFSWISGTQHPKLASLNPYLARPEPGSVTLPSSILLVNRESSNPLQRSAVHGVDLTLQSQDRSTHMLVLGLTGSGKNQRVIDPLRASAISDPAQTVVSFSLKSGDYGLVRELCRRSGKRLLVVNPGNASRTVTWNPLATGDADEARDLIRRFSDASRNLQSHDSEFWVQWIRCGLEGCWHQGLRSFPEILQFFAQPYREVVRQLHQHNNPGSARLADFLNGNSHNAETVMASILGTLTSMLAQSTIQMLSGNELNLRRIFRKPVCIHVEIPEPHLETYRPLVQMLARCIIDALIATAEQLGERRRVPATLFFDDMPSLGHLLSVERLLTLRSRAIGIVAGVQSIASLELAYGGASRALLEAFVNKVVLPGCAQPDADYFSHCSGSAFVALPTCEGQPPAFTERPLLSAADIRQPPCQHPILGRPATLFFDSFVFQAYLQLAFELPWLQPAVQAAKRVTGHERLRKKLPDRRDITNGAEQPAVLTNTDGWSAEQLREHLQKLRPVLGWLQLGPAAKVWWNKLLERYRSRLPAIVRLLEELQQRRTMMQRFYEISQLSRTDDIQSNLHFLDYLLAKDLAEQSESEAQDLF